GTERTLRAFVAGFLAGRGEHAGGVFGSDVALAAGSLGGRLRALFAAGSHHVFLAPAPLAVPLAQALGERGRELGLAVERRRLVESARFSFRAEAVYREAAAQMRGAVVTALPAGLRWGWRCSTERQDRKATLPRSESACARKAASRSRISWAASAGPAP